MGEIMGSVVTLQPSPATVFRTVADVERPVQLSRAGQRHCDRRPREFLTPEEVARIIAVARKNRHGQRDSLMVMLAYRHALRSAELVALEWSQVDFAGGWLTVNRVKNGLQGVQHPLKGDELRALRQLRRENEHARFIFLSERGQPFSEAGFQKMVVRLGEAAAIGLPVHAHMLRHSAGYKLANDGRDTRSLQVWMGHKNIQHTAHYTEMAGNRFKNWW
jgi:integrase